MPVLPGMIRGPLYHEPANVQTPLVYDIPEVEIAAWKLACENTYRGQSLRANRTERNLNYFSGSISCLKSRRVISRSSSPLGEVGLRRVWCHCLRPKI